MVCTTIQVQVPIKNALYTFSYDLDHVRSYEFTTQINNSSFLMINTPLDNRCMSELLCGIETGQNPVECWIQQDTSLASETASRDMTIHLVQHDRKTHT